MEATERFSEVVDVLTALAPTAANGTVAAHSTSYVDLADYHRAFILIHLGEAAQGATIDFTVWEAQDTAGTGVKQITSKAPAQVVAADSGGYIGIELQSEELDVQNGFHCIKLIATVGTGTYTYSAYILGTVPRYPPVGSTDFHELVT